MLHKNLQDSVHWQTNNIGAGAVNSRNQETAGTLDGVCACLVERLTAGSIGLEDRVVKVAEIHPGAGMGGMIQITELGFD